MPSHDYVLSLQTLVKGDMVEINLRGEASHPTDVQYTVNLSGSSTTRHTGRTRVVPGDPQTLSTLRIRGDTAWCATVEVVQDRDVSYTLRAGTCA